jgi:CheY-like chemotaxis protein
MHTVPCVILVEDDASIRQFVAMALEDIALKLVMCPSLDAARHALQGGETDLALVLLDMMLPDGSGLDLLKDPLRQKAGPQARWVVFSAGMAAADRQALSSLRVHDVLDKPVSLDRLLSCVDQACTAWTRAAIKAPAPAFTPVPPRSPTAKTSQQVTAPGSWAAPEVAAIQTYFFGQDQLFAVMKEQALQHLPVDIENMENILARADAAELHRAAHNLKSVTGMLGQTRAADLARALEDAATHAEPVVWQNLWHGLRAELELWRAGA